jgi:hypothetical protein
VRVGSEKTTISNSIWRSVVDIPFIGEQAFWHSVGLKKIDGRVFLEFKIWDNPVGEASIQSMYWVLLELVKGKVIPRLKQEIQKRRWDPESAVKVFDKPAKTILKPVRSGKLHWQVGKQHGEI